MILKKLNEEQCLIQKYSNAMPNRTEESEQEAVMEWASWNTGKYPELEMLHHTANEGKRSKSNGAMLKRIGLAPGFPDLSLNVAKGGYHSLHIEMKRDRESRVSKDQKEWIAKLRKYDNFAIVCYSADEAIKALEWYLKLK